jgi:hypothetical protein
VQAREVQQHTIAFGCALLLLLQALQLKWPGQQVVVTEMQLYGSFSYGGTGLDSSQ